MEVMNLTNQVLDTILAILPLKVSRGGFISPLESKQDEVPTSHLTSSTSTISIFGIEVCKTASSYAEFCEQMAEKEQDFVKSLNL